jgi:LuxR family maltose regulon positive regulatory protein
MRSPVFSTTPSTFAATKIQQPQARPGDIARPALERALGEALTAYRLVLLCAPAGWGKTVALARQLGKLPAGTAVAWVRADADDDVERFLAVLVAALDPFDLPWRVSPDALPALAARTDRMPDAVSAVVNALMQAEVARGLIAIDDAHAFADPLTFKFLDLLLAALPEQWTLAITSRVAPPMALSRLRVRHQMVEFGQEELRFSAEEVKALLARHGSPAPEAAIQALLERTHGWAAGVTMGMSVLGQSEPQPEVALRNRQRLFAYLSQEVLSHLPEALHRFLLQCSLLTELTPRRCAELTGDARAADKLQAIEERNLFVSVLEAQPLTLRLHDLFREFLMDRLHQEHAAELPELLRRAAASEPDLFHRVGLLVRAHAWQDAGSLLMAESLALIQVGAAAQLIRLLQQFPARVREASHELAFVRGLCAGARWEFTTLYTSMRRAAEGFEQQHPALALQARAMACIALVMRGRVRESQLLWTQLQDSRSTDPGARALIELCGFMQSAMVGPYQATVRHLQHISTLPASSTRTWDPVVGYQLFFVFAGRAGVRAPMQAIAEQLLGAADDSCPLLRATALQLQAWLALHRGDLAAARDIAQEVAADARWLGEPEGLVDSMRLLRVFDAVLTGDIDTVRTALAGLIGDLEHSAERCGYLVYVTFLGSFCAVLDDWETVCRAQALIEARTARPDWPPLSMAIALLRAQIALREGRAEEAAVALRDWLPKVIDCEWWALQARIRVTLARAELGLGCAAAAWRALEPALRQARQAGEPLGLLLCGPQALSELAATRWPAAARSEELACLAGCAAVARSLRSSGTSLAPTRSPAQPLTAREVEVLERITLGHSNKVIARDLGLSPHTVKRHVARILDKTAQSTRRHAAVWFRRQRAELRGTPSD